MKALSFSVSDLSEKLKENRTKHQQEYDEAFAGWKVAIRARVLEVLNNLDNGKLNPEDLTVKVPEPNQYLDSYDTVIAMLGMTEQDVIELEEHEFENYVLDQWTWKRNFNEMSSTYNSIVANAIKA